MINKGDRGMTGQEGWATGAVIYGNESAGEIPAEHPALQESIRLLVVDDHEIVRQGISQLLSHESLIDVVGEASDGAAAISTVRELHPDVVLMDINMPRMNGIEATRAICAENSGVLVIGLSMCAEPYLADDMLAAGAVSYLNKSEPPEQMITAIHAAVRGSRSQTGSTLGFCRDVQMKA
jgi:DNA-binding NarL/FixJ family response regulator